MEKGLDKSEMQSREALSFIGGSVTPDKIRKNEKHDFLDAEQNQFVFSD